MAKFKETTIQPARTFTLELSEDEAKNLAQSLLGYARTFHAGNGTGRVYEDIRRLLGLPMFWSDDLPPAALV